MYSGNKLKNDYSAMDLDETRTFYIDLSKKPSCNLEGFPIKNKFGEIRIHKKKGSDANIEFSMENSPDTNLVGSGGHLEYVEVEKNHQKCGISKILMR